MTDLMLRGRDGRRGGGARDGAKRGRDGGGATRGKVVYTKVMPQALTSAATAEGVALVGDGAGGFVFPSSTPPSTACSPR